MHEVVVGNIGTVYRGNDETKAAKIFGVYVELSEQEYGRAAGQDVTLFVDDEIALSHEGPTEEEWV